MRCGRKDMMLWPQEKDRVHGQSIPGRVAALLNEVDSGLDMWFAGLALGRAIQMLYRSREHSL